MLKTKGQTYSFTVSRAEVLNSQHKMDGAKRFLVSFVETEGLERDGAIPKEPVTGVRCHSPDIGTARGKRRQKPVVLQSSRGTPADSR